MLLRLYRDEYNSTNRRRLCSPKLFLLPRVSKRKLAHNVEVLAKAGNNLVFELLGTGRPLLPIPCYVQLLLELYSFLSRMIFRSQLCVLQPLSQTDLISLGLQNIKSPSTKILASSCWQAVNFHSITNGGPNSSYTFVDLRKDVILSITNA
jgi:hypothetical protein